VGRLGDRVPGASATTKCDDHGEGACAVLVCGSRSKVSLFCRALLGAGILWDKSGSGEYNPSPKWRGCPRFRFVWPTGFKARFSFGFSLLWVCCRSSGEEEKKTSERAEKEQKMIEGLHGSKRCQLHSGKELSDGIQSWAINLMKTPYQGFPSFSLFFLSLPFSLSPSLSPPTSSFAGTPVEYTDSSRFNSYPADSRRPPPPPPPTPPKKKKKKKKKHKLLKNII